MIIKKADPHSIEITVQYLREQKIVIVPTDTIYGFSGIVPGSAEAIIRAKGRDEGKPFIQLIGEPADLFQYTEDTIKPGLVALWPGAVTIIVKNKKEGTTAFRCPGDEWLREVIRRLGCPVYSTSVNKAGKPALKTIGEICAEFASIIDLIIDAGDQESASASTIIDATGNEYKIIRQGDLTVPPDLLRQ